MATTLPPLHRFVLLVAGLVIIAAGLRAAASPVNLLLLSMLLAGTIYPMPYALMRRGWPKERAVMVTLLGVVIGGVLLLLVLAASLRRLSANMPVYQEAFSGLVGRLNAALAARGSQWRRPPLPPATGGYVTRAAPRIFPADATGTAT